MLLVAPFAVGTFFKTQKQEEWLICKLYMLLINGKVLIVRKVYFLLNQSLGMYNDQTSLISGGTIPPATHNLSLNT
jgi:hypothetical protein